MRQLEKGVPGEGESTQRRHRIARPTRNLRLRPEGRYPGLRFERIAFPGRSPVPADRPSGIVIRPNIRLPLRGQHRNCAMSQFSERRAPVSRLTPPTKVIGAPENVPGFYLIGMAFLHAAFQEPNDGAKRTVFPTL